MSSEKNYIPKKENKYQNIISLGSSLNLDLILSLDENQYESLDIKFKEISTIEDIINFCPNSSYPNFQKLTSLIKLHSNNFLFNSILFINQSSKKKLPIKYIIPFSPKFPKELSFIYDIIKSITEKNHIYIEESNILDIKPKINFTLKLIEKDIAIEEKTFLVTNENNYNNNDDNKNIENKNEEGEKEYEGDLFEGLKFEYECDYFYTTINDLYNCKKNNENEISDFIQKLVIKYPKITICINFDENYSLNSKDFIQNIINHTDIFIFEKKDIINFYNNIFPLNKDKNNDDINENKNIKENSKANSDNSNNKLIENFFIHKIKTKKINSQIKLGIFIDNIKEIFLLQQDPKSDLILFQSNQNIELIPSNKNEDEKKNYEELIQLNYNSLKSVYVGALFNRLIRGDSFDICFKSALKCVIKYLDILKFGIDVPTIQNYYEIKNNKKNKKKINKIEIKNKQLENKFILDCTNVNNKISTYNSLYDENCVNFFNSRENRRHLQKQGFINKKGMILIDPEKYKDKLACLSKKNRKKLLENIRQKINDIKEMRNNETVKERTTHITSMNQESIRHLTYRDFEFIHKENNNSNIKHFYLPKLKNKNRDKSTSPINNNILEPENNKEDNNRKWFKLNKSKKNLSSINFTKSSNNTNNNIKKSKKNFGYDFSNVAHYYRNNKFFKNNI